jgi:hypothetical protein
MKCELQDSHLSKIQIHLGNFPLPEISRNSLEIDCVTISPRYDHGFGFSQLYRVVKDKDSTEIQNFCDLSTLTNQIHLLPKYVSDTWRVILTPTVKFNDETGKILSKNLMLKLFSLSQSDEIQSRKLLITHFGNLQSFPDKSIDGLLDGLFELSKGSFQNLTDIYIEITDKFEDRLKKQFKNKFEKVS